MKVVVLGSGNVATVLSLALANAGNELIQVWSRNATNAEKLASLLHTAFTDDIDLIDSSADLYIIAVSDDAIDSVISKMHSFKGLVVHTSGSTPIDVFKGKVKDYGVFYPFQTFSKERTVEFRSVPILLEASRPELMPLLVSLASSVSNLVKECNSDQRKALHIAAVFACNFSNHLYAVADRILEEQGLDFDLLRPLIAETAQKVQEFKPADVQTGPAVRRDMNIVNQHLNLLEDHPTRFSIYKLLTEDIISESSGS